jgi:hypothetical protein
MFTAKGGMNLTAMMEAIATTPAGEALISKLTGLKEASNTAQSLGALRAQKASE